MSTTANWIAKSDPSSYSGEVTHASSSLPPLGVAIYGLGGLGVVGLSKNLSLALQEQYLKVASTETRGIAQRRAPVRAIVRAGSNVRTATAPDSQIDIIVALESSEALRAAPLMIQGRTCLLSDLRIAPSGLTPAQAKAIPDAAAIAPLLRQLGVNVHVLRVSDWLMSHHFNDALTSSIALGAMTMMLGLSTRACEEMLLARLKGHAREQNAAAFAHGVSQFATPVVARPITSYRDEVTADSLSLFPSTAAVA